MARFALISTKAKREAIAKRIETELPAAGVTVERREVDPKYPNEVFFTLSKGPYRCMVELDPTCTAGGFVNHWYTDYRDGDAKYPREFEYATGGTMNMFHFRKATTIALTVEQMMKQLIAGFALLEIPAETPAVAA